ncbi:MAG: DNA polymerase III subunit delta [Syntrophobacterales bacterium]|jgi:DNA polymerase-3 subunit delta|nr:DNA polymerase III subunit delta [Syntrophobacterales bacterium]
MAETSTDNFPQVLTQIKKGQIRPVYLLYGDEEFLLERNLDQMISLILGDADRTLNLFPLAGGSDEANEICATLALPPLFAGRKVVVVRDTLLFHSQKTLSSLIKNIRSKMEKRPAQAVASFMLLLEMAGWALDDLKDGAWKNIAEEKWEHLLGDEHKGREQWIPAMIDLCIAHDGGKAAAKKSGGNTLEDTLLRIPPENHLILVAETVDRRKKLFKVISSVGAVLHFPKAKAEQKQKERIMAEARDVLAAAGKKMTAGAWDVLGSKTGFQLRDSVQAIEKLIAFSGDSAVIREDDVEEAVGKSREEDVFQLVTAMAEKNLPASLEILRALVLQGVPWLMIFAVIGREMRHLYQAKCLIRHGVFKGFRHNMDYGEFQQRVMPNLKGLVQGGKKDLGLAGQHPYAIYQTLKRAAQFREEDLLSYLNSLLEMDLLIKSSGRSESLMLERFLITVCQGK